jgi:hypothetical protein
MQRPLKQPASDAGMGQFPKRRPSKRNLNPGPCGVFEE